MKKMTFGGLTACGFVYGYRRFGGILAQMCQSIWVSTLRRKLGTHMLQYMDIEVSEET